MITKEEAYKRINDLVVRFDEQLSSYKSINYNETLTRRDFIDPFFQALGWDLDNSQGYAEAYREVIHEDRVKIDKATKAPDYSFKLAGGKRLFFVEAKKPSVSIKYDGTVAYQIRRYGWSAKLPVSIITDFEEFAVYDCTKKPVITDQSSVARIKYITYKQYLEEFEFLWDTFSKERVLKGSFDKFVLGTANKKGTTTVDKEFLISLDNWRTKLATSISLKNKELDEDEINFVVQQTIDRSIFLRIAEDRSIETYGNLKSALIQGDYYQNLFTIFTEADQKYNSGLFDLKKDQISKDVKIENKVLKTVINQLYYPESPYEFSVLSVEILGSAYEQFLGKQIKIDKYHRASIEEKPEVRKAGGVYYTPQYVVEYIVKNTVGKMIEGKTPPEVSKITICDPACGSGSFLIGAYQYLLDWHRAYYQQDIGASPDASNMMDARGLAHVEEIKTMADARGLAHVEEMKKIADARGLNIGASTNASNLLDARGLNIGASPNASNQMDARGLAHVDKKSKSCLTPEGNLTTAEKKRILLNNIYGVDIDVNAVEVTKLSLLLKCMEGETEASIATQINMFKERVLPTLDNNIKDGNSLIDIDYYATQMDFGEEKKIKPFSWQKAFAEVFKQGGFDCVIGNPPYGALFSNKEIEYFKIKYKTAVWRSESYLLFIEQALKLLKLIGHLGFIIPDTLLNLGFTQPSRELILMNSKLQEIVGLPSNVFTGAVVDTIILLTQKTEYHDNLGDLNILVKTFGKKQTINSIKDPDKEFYANDKDWFEQKAFNIQTDISENNLLQKMDRKEQTISKISEIFYGIKVYQVGKGKPNQTEEIRDEKPFTSLSKIDNSWLPFYDGKHIGRYQLLWHDNNWINYGEWLAEPRKPSLFEGEKILIRKITGKTLIATYIPDTSYCNTLLFILKLKDNSFTYKSILAILNSKLIGWYFRMKFQISDDDTFPQIMIRDILQFPIPIIDKKYDSELIALVDQLLKLNEEKAETKLQTKISQIESKIDYCENRINQIVYQLYDLTEEEIKIVEGV